MNKIDINLKLHSQSSLIIILDINDLFLIIIQKFRIEKDQDKVEWVSPLPISALKSFRRSHVNESL